jgi:hypothetical protein
MKRENVITCAICETLESTNQGDEIYGTCNMHIRNDK